MAIEHDYFGLLESRPDGSIFWSENVEFGDQSVTVDVTSPEQEDVTSAALDAAASLITALAEIDRRAREAMIAELSDRTSEVIEYILQQQQALGEGIHEFLTDISDDIQIEVIRSLSFVSMTVLADEHGSAEPFAVLEYALDPDAADEVLLVNFDSDAEVLSVTSAE